MNPRIWPAPLIDSQVHPPVAVALPDNEFLERRMVDRGMQLAGGGHLRDVPMAPPTAGMGLQLNEALPLPSPYRLRPDGLFQLAGGSRAPPDLSTRHLLALQTSPSVPRSGGIGSWQFVQEFVPSVYLNPYSGHPDTYPNEFISNYDLYTESVDGYD